VRRLKGTDGKLRPGRGGRESGKGGGPAPCAEDAARRRFLLALPGIAAPLLAGPSVLGGTLRPQPRPGAEAGRAVASRGGRASSVLAGSPLADKTACLAVDTATGAVILAHRSDAFLPPASVTKILTALYGLETLGADYRFATRLEVNGPVEGGRIRGDVVLAGGGDPTLDTRGLAELAARLAAAGVREIEGRFLFDEHALPQLRALAADQPITAAYNPGLSGLNLNFNRVHFSWERRSAGLALALDARAGPLRPGVGCITIEAAERASPVYRYRIEADRAERWSVARRALGRRGSRWLPVRLPGRYAADVFRTLARSHGIVLPPPLPAAGARDGFRVLVGIESEPLDRVLKGMLRYSTNLTAEAVGLRATHRRTGRVPPGLARSAEVMADWARHRFGLTRLSLHDHSGLHDATRISPRELMTVLRDGRAREMLLPLLKEVKPGQLARRRERRPVRTRGHVRAKTGTLHFVSALAGYVEAADGHLIAFVIQSADLDRRARIDRRLTAPPAGARRWKLRARELQRALLIEWLDRAGGSGG